MNNLTKISDSVYGTKYAMEDSYPFNTPNISKLKWGDVHKDNGAQD
jgi:hypothetical protein